MIATATQQPDPFLAKAREISRTHQISDRPPAALSLLTELPAISKWFDQILIACEKAGFEETKAAEWLLDNHFQVRRAIRQIGKDMPAAFYGRLPSLENPGNKMLPRVFCIGCSMLNAGHFQISLASTINFVLSYEEESPLTIAELWALPTMLRLACMRILIEATQRIFLDLQPVFKDTQLGEEQQALDPTECIARALSGLREIAAIPWKDFFDGTSHVEAALRRDPAGIYGLMDFDTRDLYRKAVENLSNRSRYPEVTVVEQALALAKAYKKNSRRGHVGYWLIDAGRQKIETALKCRRLPGAAVGGFILSHAGKFYAAALATATLAALMVPILFLWQLEVSMLVWVIAIMLSILPASVLSITLVHWIATMALPPRVLPKLDFTQSIPIECRTAVVIPAIVGGINEVKDLLERLEMHWLMNPAPFLHFVLLSDYADAPSAQTSGDLAIQTALVNGIRRLNARHDNQGALFHLLHRPRTFNPSESCWMGWERKRGKLEQFNRFVLNGKDSSFSFKEGDTKSLIGIRFILTVDADTMLPAGVVERLIGTLAHPLNKAEFDLKTGRLTGGYTIIQPRVELSPESGTRSYFSRCYAGDTAIDIYSRAVSNVYQDIFGSAIFVGKGLYDVEAFQRCLDGRVPENALLSHDLFEGAYGRVALASDIIIYDGFPDSYVEHAQRSRRWIRGDWQLLPWLANHVPSADSRQLKNQLTALDRWKIFDNLRRSLIPGGLVLFAIAGWFVFPGNPWLWTILTIATPGAYLFTDLVTGLAHGRRRDVVRGTLNKLSNHFGRWLLAIVFLLPDALVSLDAIFRTLWRLGVSHKRLLAWKSAAHTANQLASSNLRSNAWRTMWPSTAISLMILAALAAVNPPALLPAAVLSLPWLVAPEIAAWISRPSKRVMKQLSRNERKFLRNIARRTWLYFETFAGPEDHWLPPDNFQMDPRGEIAHRTSPTNIGMLFLSSLSAWDLGFIDTVEFMSRVKNTLDTLAQLEQHRGHLLNWYDTRHLTPLEPQYVSTVDSGNLAVSLITLKESCLEMIGSSVVRTVLWDGLADTLAALDDAVNDMAEEAPEELRQQFETMYWHITTAHDQASQGCATVDRLANLSEIVGSIWPVLEKTILGTIEHLNDPSGTMLRAIHVWLERVNHHLARMQSVFEQQFPWLILLLAPPAECEPLALDILDQLPPNMPLEDAESLCTRVAELLADTGAELPANKAALQWRSEIAAAITQGGQAQLQLKKSLLDVATRAEAMAFAMDFKLLYDAEAKLFHIGYNVSSDRIDLHHYDLLATEARLASYFAIAK